MPNFQIKKFILGLGNLLKRELIILWSFGTLLAFALIILQNKAKLPAGKGDFVFLAVISLLVSLYRPRWIFFLFVLFVPLENIILVSDFLPIQLRPYQFLGAVLIIALAILHTAKKLKFAMTKPNWIDWLLLSLVPLGFLALVNSSQKNSSGKQVLVLFSFFALYFLARNFMRRKDDLAKTFFFFTGSFLVVTLYGFFQIFADKFGGQSFEVMFGRPNSTFTEPDWLGVFLVFALAAFLSASKSGLAVSFKWKFFIYVCLLLDLTLLILTLSRSAWIGAACVGIFYLLLNSFKKEKGGVRLTPKPLGTQSMLVFSLVILSLSAIHLGKLSKFDIFDRARSAATNEQKITIACENSANVPSEVSGTEELLRSGCSHINLEDIGAQKAQGKFVTEIYRRDPNIVTRGAIYKKSWEIIKSHPLTGVGYGTIGRSLGQDERGTGLNESNILLQTWAGSGIAGLAAFLAALAYLLIQAMRRISPVCPLNKFVGCPIVKDNFEKAKYTFIFLGLVGLLVPNMFNAGLFMGIFWLGLAAFVNCQNEA